MKLTTPKRRISQSKRIAAAAMIDLGIPSRQVGAELGMSHETALQCAADPYINPDNVAVVKARMTDRMIVASDRFLSQGLDGIQNLHPYQAVLCAGIMHDHYLRSTQAQRGDRTGSITQILVLIDQRSRGTND